MPARKAAADRRGEILRGAIRVIARKGFTAVTTRDVAAEVGVTHGLIHHYFPTRDALVAAAFDLAAGEELTACYALVTAIDDPAEQLAVACEPPALEHYLLWIDAWSEAPRNVELARTLRRHQRGWESHLARLVQSGVEAKRFAPDDVTIAVKSLTATLDGLAVQRFSMGTLTATEHRALIAGAITASVRPGQSSSRRTRRDDAFAS